MFTYDKNSKGADILQILEKLISNWENEIVEFKEAKGQYDTNKVGQYFSAISNEANLRKQQFGWLIFGISETNKETIVGSNFKKGKGLLENSNTKYLKAQMIT
ncbi:MAG: ATP-binding protein [Erysipelotrichaceae bacterium]|nr:ATP-binding protein [Erysipelotrichaceae bacterium]